MATSPSAPPSVTALPTAPSRSNPTTFRSLMDAFLAAMVTFRTEIVALSSWKQTTATQVYNNAVEAATSAGNAATSEENASASETAAAASEAAATAVLLGQYASDAAADAAHPTAPNGAIYYNTTTDVLRTLSAGTWVAAAVDASGALQASQNLNDLNNAATARTNLGGVPTLTGTETLTNKTLTGMTVDGSVTEEIYAWTGTTGTVSTEMEPANGTVQTVTLTGNITSLTDNLAAGESITVMVDDGTSYTVTWPTATWITDGGTAPTLKTTGYTTIVFWKISTTLYAALAGEGG